MWRSNLLYLKLLTWMTHHQQALNPEITWIGFVNPMFPFGLIQVVLSVKVYVLRSFLFFCQVLLGLIRLFFLVALIVLCTWSSHPRRVVVIFYLLWLLHLTYLVYFHFYSIFKCVLTIHLSILILVCSVRECNVCLSQWVMVKRNGDCKAYF